ncbi:glycosyltransferase family 4 protein [Haladaptatus paucihalophilus]|uniref:Glycosyltransferase involved in cell wall bisynthesis n=1 Tax=Haladaptatus paucihalophilus DX253 TaxID=797209 RepID=A0A1M6P5N7_HALPU|nr:glycosyltransferase family 4 protein [Haladaptatus paucihalophilus]SHK03248.1 Glycosyltransferase involved in cell wall bisynthesis [Haladaptatus paucihalophilus DX253]
MSISPGTLDPNPNGNPTNTLFVGTFFHDIHCAFAEAIGADVFSLFGPKYEEWDSVAESTQARLRHYVRKAREIPSGYDNYLLEGGTSLIPAALFTLRNRNANTILLNADETFINVIDGVEHYGKMDAYVHQLCSRSLDGLVNVGDFAGMYARRANLDVQSVTVYPGIKDELYRRLGTIPVSVGSKNIVVVGYGKNHARRTGGSSTGFDLLVEAMPDIRDVHPESELHIAGKGHPKAWEKHAGVVLHGWVADLAEFFSHGEVSAHPGRSESFSVAALEPMRAARPCIVSNMVGAKDVVEEVSETLVCEPTVAGVRETLIDYFDRSEEKRREMCEQARVTVEGFDESSVVTDFVNEYTKLCEQLSETAKAK